MRRGGVGQLSDVGSPRRRAGEGAEWRLHPADAGRRQRLTVRHLASASSERPRTSLPALCLTAPAHCTHRRMSASEGCPVMPASLGDPRRLLGRRTYDVSWHHRSIASRLRTLYANVHHQWTVVRQRICCQVAEGRLGPMCFRKRR